MIDEITGQRLVLCGQVLLVSDSQREIVEKVLRECGSKNTWSRAVSAVEPYNDFTSGDGVSVWAVSLYSEKDAERVQLALDAQH